MAAPMNPSVQDSDDNIPMTALSLAHLLVDTISGVLDGRIAPAVLIEAVDFGESQLARLDDELLAMSA